MSTRATYEFNTAPEWSPRVAFYIHHDGYHEGAAAYFYAMLMHPNDRGGLAAKFLRANDLAEFTSGHDAHGDTEHEYTVTGSSDAGANLSVRSRRPGGAWAVSFAGTLAAFIDANQGMIDNYEPFKQADVGYMRKMWLNATHAQTRLDGKVKTLTTWAENARKRGESPVNGGNWRSLVNEARDLIRAFPGVKAESEESAVYTEINVALAAEATT